MSDIGLHQHPHPEIDSDPASVGRRRFLGVLSGLLSTVIAAAVGLPLARFYVGNAFAAQRERWLRLGRAADVKPGVPSLFHSSYLDMDGWRQIARRQAVYAVTQDGRAFTLFASACTHLGCPVHWDEETKLFVCPCHGGGFSLEGKVVKGPPPRPLAQLAYKVEKGTLYVRAGRV